MKKNEPDKRVKKTTLFYVLGIGSETCVFIGILIYYSVLK